MLFHERLKTANNEWPSTFQRKSFPQNVRSQCWQNLKTHEEFYKVFCEQMRESVGKYELNNAGSRGYGFSYEAELNYFFHHGLKGGETAEDTSYAFSVLELLCQSCRYDDHKIDAVNLRLRQAGIGYKFFGESLIPIDDEHLEQTIQIPLASLLNQGEFRPIYNYFHQAFEDYKNGGEKSLESSIDNCQKALETLLQHIFTELDIDFKENWTYRRLVQTAREASFFPPIEDDKDSPIMNELQALANLRNAGGGHGGKSNTSDKLVRLAINHAMANALYIAECYLEIKSQ